MFVVILDLIYTSELHLQNFIFLVKLPNWLEHIFLFYVFLAHIFYGKLAKVPGVVRGFWKLPLPKVFPLI